MATVLGGLTLAPAAASLAASGPPALDLASGTRRKTWYGINATDSSAVQARMVHCAGHIGVARCFYTGMLPARWNASKEGASPQSACHVSFKAAPGAVASGHHDARILSWLNSIPAGWRVYITFWHEPNDELRAGRFSAKDYRAAWSRLSHLARERASLRRDVVVRLVPVFMAYNVARPGFWSDSWAPRPAEVAFLSWDIYGNPSGGAGLSGKYPHPRARIDPCLHVTQRLGFEQWGVSEFNAPARTWDTDESARRSWLADFTHYALSTDRSVAPSLGAPRTFMLWEGHGVNWNETFKTAPTWSWWTRAAKSA